MGVTKRKNLIWLVSFCQGYIGCLYIHILKQILLEYLICYTFNVIVSASIQTFAIGYKSNDAHKAVAKLMISVLFSN